MRNLLSSILFLFFLFPLASKSDPVNYTVDNGYIRLDSKDVHQGGYEWKMMKAGEVTAPAEKLSMPGFKCFP
jgi:hypothetical protein